MATIRYEDEGAARAGVNFGVGIVDYLGRRDADRGRETHHLRSQVNCMASFLGSILLMHLFWWFYMNDGIAHPLRTGL